MYANGCIETSAASSTFSLNGTGDEEEFVCERCHVSETQLKEAFDELSSAQTIINILQNELLASKTSMFTLLKITLLQRGSVINQLQRYGPY